MPLDDEAERFAIRWIEIYTDILSSIRAFKIWRSRVEN